MTSLLQLRVVVCVLAASWTAGFAPLAFAQRSSLDEITLPLRFQPDLLLKVTGYDLEHEYRAGYRIGIVFSLDDKSATVAKEFAQFLPHVHNKRPVGGLPVPFTNGAQLREFFRSNRINIVYVCPGNDQNLATILQVARELDILTSTGIEKYVRDGVALGLHGVSAHGRDIKRQISVNRSAVKFDAWLLLEARKVFP